MPTLAYVVGTTSREVTVALKPRQLADVQIQNLSVNNVYVGSDQSVDTTSGIKVPPNGQYVNVKRQEPIWLIADGAGSDVRIHVEIYTTTTKTF
jgi:hypothetical protein